MVAALALLLIGFGLGLMAGAAGVLTCLVAMGGAAINRALNL